MSAEFVANMEDVLESSCSETRPSLPPRPGTLRQDYEYRRDLFLACEPLAGWRQVAVTQRAVRAACAAEGYSNPVRRRTAREARELVDKSSSASEAGITQQFSEHTNY